MESSCSRTVWLVKLGEGNGLTCLAELFGRRSSVSPGVPQSVPDHAGSVELFAGPPAGVSGQSVSALGGHLLAGAGGLARTGVLQVRAGVTKVQYTPHGKHVARISGDESRFIVALDGQWGSAPHMGKPRSSRDADRVSGTEHGLLRDI